MFAEPSRDQDPRWIELNAVGAGEMDGIQYSVYDEADLSPLRVPEVSVDLVQDLLDNPERFGIQRIREAIEFLQPELRDIHGMVRWYERAFVEPDPAASFDPVYEVKVIRSFYDPKIVSSISVNSAGIHLRDNKVLTLGGISEYEMRSGQQPYHFQALLLPNEEISVQSSVLSKRQIIFGKPGRFDMTRWDGIVLGKNTPYEVDCWAGDLLLRSHDDIYAIYAKITEKPLQLPVSETDETVPGYTAEIDARRVPWSLRKEVRIRNLGPKSMGLVFMPNQRC